MPLNPCICELRRKHIRNIPKSPNLPCSKPCIYKLREQRINRERKNIPSKSCTKCNTEKTIDEFYLSSTKPDGYDSYCKSCRKHYNDLRKQRKTKINEDFVKEELTLATAEQMLHEAKLLTLDRIPEPMRARLIKAFIYTVQWRGDSPDHLYSDVRQKCFKATNTEYKLAYEIAIGKLPKLRSPKSRELLAYILSLFEAAIKDLDDGTECKSILFTHNPQAPRTKHTTLRTQHYGHNH